MNKLTCLAACRSLVSSMSTHLTGSRSAVRTTHCSYQIGSLPSAGCQYTYQMTGYLAAICTFVDYHGRTERIGKPSQRQNHTEKDQLTCTNPTYSPPPGPVALCRSAGPAFTTS